MHTCATSTRRVPPQTLSRQLQNRALGMLAPLDLAECVNQLDMEDANESDEQTVVSVVF